jgi:hypothetical protein
MMKMVNPVVSTVTSSSGRHFGFKLRKEVTKSSSLFSCKAAEACEEFSKEAAEAPGLAGIYLFWRKFLGDTPFKSQRNILARERP